MTAFIDVASAISYPAGVQIFRRSLASGILFLVMAGSVCAEGLQAQLDSTNQQLPMDQATILPATLTNTSTATFYITGMRIDLSHNASAQLYKEDILLQQLRTLGAGQSWDGPLIAVTPAHRGALLVTGSIKILGGTVSTSSAAIASIPVQLPVSDSNRNADGSFLRGVDAACNRPTAVRCCDDDEAMCFQAKGHCIYIADGFNQQSVCRDGVMGKIYEHISNLLVSSDGAHIVYLGSDQCGTTGLEESCQARVVTDTSESPDYEAVNGPCFSPDGENIAYEVGMHCHLQPATTSNSQDAPLQCHESAVWIDGIKGSVLPSWCSIPIAMRTFQRTTSRAH